MARSRMQFNENELYYIIRNYREYIKPDGKITYSEIHKYNIELNKSNPNECPKVYSIDFWKRKNQPGRKLIDQNNELRKIILTDESYLMALPNIYEIIEKYADSKEQLMRHLRPADRIMKKQFENIKELQNKNKELEERIENLKIEKDLLINRNKTLEDTIQKLFRYSDKSGVHLENMINISNKEKRIMRALDGIFDKPTDFLVNIVLDTNSLSDNTKLISISSKKKSIADDYKGKF